MEPVEVRVAAAESVDIDQLAALAACTFPLACPPSVTAENIASFVDAHLSVARFAEYLADPQRVILVAAHGNRLVGYAMLVSGVGDDADVQRAVSIRPAVELSKMYVLPDSHGMGVSTALIAAAIDAAAESGADCIWLGVNQQNQRAQRFYRKHGFSVTGTRTFQLGTRRENDYVMVRQFPRGPRRSAPAAVTWPANTSSGNRRPASPD
ncbi:N-acetyltransferase [Mycobacterium noviomagense]|uniref:N-acetyltransferase n=1 Tax=Mycobacterium noviomagense TaxID=459858 RepID=A0A7I7PI25_9MYCO|nr:GNAT family N-acetyltransferase [Mycobacterium noviomagense]BBY08150.1 N-acetyltransferase [Mycobacterium noviomagense]